MSSSSGFTSALPANLPKFQIISGIKRSLDVASGLEYVTALIKMLTDTAVAYDVYTPIRRYADYGIGYDVYKSTRRYADRGVGYDVYKPGGLLVLLRKLDVAGGLEYLARVVRVLDTFIALLEVVGRVDRQLPAEIAETVELLARTITTFDAGVGSSAESAHPITGGELRQISSKELDAVGRDLFTVGYPVAETPIQDLINAYQRALQQLSSLKQGRYAYAQDWNVLADYAKAIINVLVNQFNVLYARGVMRYVDLYITVLECHRILSTYKYLMTGDVIMPEHTNTLIDVARCLNLTIRQLLRKAITRYSKIDVGTGLDKAKLLAVPPWSIVLVNTDDWSLTSSLIEDGTIVFVNFGTTAMTPSDVRNIVENKEVVFAILVDTQPFREYPTGAFYEVFYTYPMLSNIDESYYFDIIDDAFLQELGFTGCRSFRIMRKILDYTIAKYYKKADVVNYATSYYAPNLYYSYAKYKKGAIIEMPYDGSWQLFDQLDWYIGAIAHILLGEPNRCYIAYNPVKIKRIVWMASYGTTIPYGYPSADRALSDLADRSGWTLIDARNEW